MQQQPSTPQQDPTTVAGLVASARARLLDADGQGEYLAKALCTDVLLDCLNVAVRPPVQKVILERLPEFSHGNLTTAEDFGVVLDEIQLALQVDAAFDDCDLELEAL